MRCRSCDARFELHEIATALDDQLDELTADVPCDRL